MNVSSVPDGILRLEQLPSPNQDVTVYALRGDATTGPIQRIETTRNLSLPPRRNFSYQHPFRLKILHFNDLHGHICHFTEHGEVPLFANMVSRIKALRLQAQERDDVGVLVMSAGDDLVGSIFDELLNAKETDHPVHVSYRLFSAAGVDVATLGNHDFDMGPTILAESIRRDANFPLLSANLTGSSLLQSQILPAALFIIKGVRVGVIGISTPGEIKEQWLDTFSLLNPIPTIHNILPALRPICDVIIILSHLGYSISSHAAAMRYAGDVELAKSLSPGSVQLIVGGHTHHILNERGLSPSNIINGIPIVQAGNLGEFLGEVDITIRDAPAVTNARLTRTALLPTDEAFHHHHIEPIEKQVKPLLDRPLGRTANTPDLDTECIRNDFAAGESAFANFITDALVSCCHTQGYHVDLAFVDATSIRSGIPVNDVLTYGDWFKVMPFADTIILYELTGQELIDLVQDNARRIDLPGEPHIERGFLHFSQELRYTIKLDNQRSRIKARNITFANESLENHPDKIFIAASTSFVREPARSWEKMKKHDPQFPIFHLHQLPHRTTNLFLRTELVNYIVAHGGVTTQAGVRSDNRLTILYDTKNSKNQG